MWPFWEDDHESLCSSKAEVCNIIWLSQESLDDLRIVTWSGDEIGSFEKMPVLFTTVEVKLSKANTKSIWAKIFPSMVLIVNVWQYNKSYTESFLKWKSYYQQEIIVVYYFWESMSLSINMFYFIIHKKY